MKVYLLYENGVVLGVYHTSAAAVRQAALFMERHRSGLFHRTFGNRWIPLPGSLHYRVTPYDLVEDGS